MRELYVADSETDPFDGETFVAPFIWGLYNGIEYHEFGTTEEFIAYVRDLEILIYAHNGGKFDWFFLLAYIEPNTPITVINGRLACFRIGRAEFRDSYNILPSPLSAYKKDEIDYAIFTKEKRAIRANFEKIREYLRSDCLYLYQFVKRFIDEYGLHLTFASCALKQWEKLEEIKAPSTTKEFFDDISQYYYGGRVECFQTGIHDKPFVSIDINSAYPWAGNHLHPYGTGYECGGVLPSDGDELGRCFLTIETASRGALPFRNPDTHALTFPSDGEKRTFHITGWEFRAARETGFLPFYTIERIVTFPHTISFNKYNAHFFAQKIAAERAGDKAGREIAKYMLNGLTGKFGANPENYEEFTILEPKYVEAAGLIDGYRFVDNLGENALLSRPLPETRHRYYNVAVIASITGFVRAHLWRSMCKCTGVLYVDTDNIKCESPGNLEIDASTLGHWKLEAECVRGAFAGKKLYSCELRDGTFKNASKGVRLTTEELFRVARGEEVKHSPQVPTYSLKVGTKFVSRKIRKQA